MTSTEVRQVGASAQDSSEKTMAPRMFDVVFPYDTQLIFGSLIFVTGEDGDLKMLPTGPTPKHLALASSLASGSPAHDRISVHGVTSTPPRLFGVPQS
jgi:hypothetical protein